VPVAFATSSTAITPVTIPAQAALNSDTDIVNDYKNASLSYRDKWLLQHIAQRILEIGGGLTVLGVILLVVVKQKSNYHGSRVLAKE
jgi:formate-dependent phosphoribosylglycinamide formyltransferase (GAR transformylase)